MSRVKRARGAAQRVSATRKDPVSGGVPATVPAAVLCLVLCAAAAASYWGVLSAGFVNYDDDLYVSANPHVKAGLAADSLAWAFRISEANWHPLTWISHMADVQLCGLDAGCHHRTNLIFHLANSMLLLLFLYRLTAALWRSALVAALFALHPLHVESVAWIAERKDLLCSFFGILTCAAWLGFVRHRRPSWYALSLALFALGLMAKPMLVTLPFLLLLLDFWPLGRMALPASGSAVRLGHLLVEKAPFFVLTGISSAVTYVAQRRGGAIENLARLSLASRISNALVAYTTYVWKVFWPARLAAFYPYPAKEYPASWVIFCVVFLLAATIGCLLVARRAPAWAVGWFWFLGSLVPVIGLVQVGSQAYADRYTYLPLIGIFIALAWASAGIAGRWRALRYGILGAWILALLALGLATRAQTAHWKDSAALWRHALAVTKDNWIAHNGMGLALSEAGDTQGAITQFEKSLAIAPDFMFARMNLGRELMGSGHPDLAIEQFDRAVKQNPRFAAARTNLGAALAAQGRWAEAIAQCRRALEMTPQNVKALNHLGIALSGAGQISEAIAAYEKAHALDPSDADSLNNLGLALARMNRTREAEHRFQEALEIRPSWAEARNNLGVSLAQQGRMAEALQQFQEAYRLDPNYAEAATNIRRAKEALRAPSGRELPHPR